MMSQLDKYYYRVNCIFMFILSIYCMCGLILPFQFIVSNKIVTAIMTLLGLLIAIFNLFIKKIYSQVFKIKYLFLFLLVNLITCISVLQYGYTTNLKNMIVFAVYFLTIYPMFSLFGGILSKKIYYGVLYIVVAFNSIGVLVSLAQFVLLIGYKSENYKGRLVRQGFIESRLFGIFSDPNYLSIVSLISIIFLIIGVGSLLKKQNILRWTLVTINFIYIVLSGSRTTLICLILVTLIFSIIKFSYERAFLKYLVKVILSVLLVMLSYKIVGLSSENYLKLNENTIRVENKKIEQKYSLERTDTSEENISNNRFTIWKSTLKLTIERPILGFSSGNWYEVAKISNPNEYVVQQHYHTHNGYLEMLFYNGILGLIIMFVFVLSYIKEIVLKFKKVTYSNQLLLITLITVVILVSNLFLSSTFYGINLLGIFLFMNIGYYWGVLCNCDEIKELS